LRKTKCLRPPAKLVAVTRELRDRWLEHANANPEMLSSNGKYELSREATEQAAISPQKLLEAA